MLFSECPPFTFLDFIFYGRITLLPIGYAAKMLRVKIPGVWFLLLLCPGTCSFLAWSPPHLFSAWPRVQFRGPFLQISLGLSWAALPLCAYILYSSYLGPHQPAQSRTPMMTSYSPGEPGSWHKCLVTALLTGMQPKLGGAWGSDKMGKHTRW